jgi:hypothetical protein
VIPRPATGEYDPYYAGYIALAENELFAQLERHASIFRSMVTWDEKAAEASPSPGEWSLKEVLVHLCDFERMFTYRALRFSRGDTTPVEAFEQDPYVAASNANATPLASIVRELAALREATILMFRSMPGEALIRRGIAGGNEVSVRALAHVIAGHCEGHLNDVSRHFPEWQP